MLGSARELLKLGFKLKNVNSPKDMNPVSFGGGYKDKEDSDVH